MLARLLLQVLLRLQVLMTPRMPIHKALYRPDGGGVPQCLAGGGPAAAAAGDLLNMRA